MPALYRLRTFIFFILFIQLLPATGWCQVTYFYQDFGRTTALINPQPDTSQFSHIILTAPQLSYHKFHKGYLELTRTRQDSATGGIIRVMRATPFTPSPEALFIETTLSAESISSAASNALYFYVGENFDPVNNSFPGNQLMFSKYAVSFTDKGLLVKDLATQLTSDTIGVGEKVKVSWVLNNGDFTLSYQSPDGNRQLAPGRYDLWAGNEAITLDSPAYPSGSPYTPTKLSNFEMRFRNGLGKVRIHKMLIRGLELTPEFPSLTMAPNPVTGPVFLINIKGVWPGGIRLFSISGKEIPIYVSSAGQSFQVRAGSPVPAGLYVLHYRDYADKLHASRLLVK